MGWMSWNIQNVLVSWLILTATGSSFLLGIANTLNFAPRVLGIISGTLADRMDRRKLLITINAANILFSFIMGSLVLGGEIQFWHIALIVLIGSALGAFSQPTQTSYAMDLAGKENITNAVALDSIGVFITGIIGPSLVGAFVNVIGVGIFFYFNALLYAAAMALLVTIRRAPSEAKDQDPETRSNVLDDIKEGFSFSWNNKTVFGGQMIYLVTNLYMWPCVWTLVPIFAYNELHLDASGLGWLTAMNRLGGTVANIVLAAKEPKRKGQMLFVSFMGWGVAWLLFSMVKWMPVSMASMFILGLVGSFTMTLGSILLLANTAPEMRGRVTGVQTLAISSQAPGSLIAGTLAQNLGGTMAINLEAILFIGSMLAAVKIAPTLRKAE